jgi:large subunit ribosomal protein L13
MADYLLIDATNKIMGRMCSQIAKKALLGYHIVVINAQDTLISGNKRDVYENYLDKLRISTSTNPKKGPFHKRRPDTFLKRVIKQMLPRKTIRGKEATKRIHVYIGEIPDRFKNRYQNVRELELSDCEKERLQHYNKIISLKNLCDRIGSWKKAEV